MVQKAFESATAEDFVAFAAVLADNLAWCVGGGEAYVNHGCFQRKAAFLEMSSGLAWSAWGDLPAGVVQLELSLGDYHAMEDSASVRWGGRRGRTRRG